MQVPGVSDVVNANILVVEKAQVPLLGKNTATALGVLHIGPKVSVNAIQLTQTTDFCAQLKEQYKGCFEGLGKLRYFQLSIHLDSSASPVAQAVCRLPFSVRKPVKEKLQQLENMDVTEKVEGPTPWISPLVVMPKRRPYLC